MSAGPQAGEGSVRRSVTGSGPARLGRLEVAVEAVVGNRLGAGVYRRWVAGLGLAGDERVVEIGTGGGACARHLADALPHGTLTCVESDARWLEIARRRLRGFGSRVRFVGADAAEFSCPGAYDVAVAHFVLHDMPVAVRTEALTRIAESLAAGGTLRIREPLSHGMSAAELSCQLRDAGFDPVGDERREKVPLMGETVSSTWRSLR